MLLDCQMGKIHQFIKQYAKRIICKWKIILEEYLEFCQISVTYKRISDNHTHTQIKKDSKKDILLN